MTSVTPAFIQATASSALTLLPYMTVPAEGLALRTDSRKVPTCMSAMSEAAMTTLTERATMRRSAARALGSEMTEYPEADATAPTADALAALESTIRTVPLPRIVTSSALRSR